MKMSFGNIDFETNIFHVTKQPKEMPDTQEVDLVESIVQDYVEREFVEDPLERAIDFSEENLNSTISKPELGAVVDWLEVCPIMSTKNIVCIDFLGVEEILKNTQPHSMFTYSNNFGPYFKDPHKVMHSPMISALGAHLFMVPPGPKENILFLKPCDEAWERLGAG